MIIYRHESFPFAVAKLVQGYEEWYGSTPLRFPEDVFDRATAPYWLKHILLNLKADQKRPFVLALDDGRRGSFTHGELKQSKCSWIIFHSGWNDEKDVHQWAWKVLKAWPQIVDKCQAAFDGEKHCRLSVSIRGRITIDNL